jgi:hypothetical protein
VRVGAHRVRNRAGRQTGIASGERPRCTAPPSLTRDASSDWGDTRAEDGGRGYGRASWGQYEPAQLVTLGFNRWAIKPEVGVSHQRKRRTIECYAGMWLFTANDEYYPAHARKEQDPVLAAQAHASCALARRSWMRSTARGLPAVGRAWTAWSLLMNSETSALAPCIRFRSPEASLSRSCTAPARPRGEDRPSIRSTSRGNA